MAAEEWWGPWRRDGFKMHRHEWQHRSDQEDGRLTGLCEELSLPRYWLRMWRERHGVLPPAIGTLGVKRRLS